MAELIDISPLVSASLGVWPGDVPFEHEVSLSLDNGDNLTLGAMRTTFHVGAHADAPSHYGRGLPAIAERPLDLYYGRCQVVAVRLPRNRRIQVDDVTTEINAPRVLFKTGSFVDLRGFSRDFNALSARLVEFLHERGTRLVGIDTPSIDLFDDKELESHQAVARHDMGILEGLVLEHVEPGFYTLVALPLRLHGADASPVRAALVAGGP